MEENWRGHNVEDKTTESANKETSKKVLVMMDKEGSKGSIQKTIKKESCEVDRTEGEKVNDDEKDEATTMRKTLKMMEEEDYMKKRRFRNKR